MGRTTEYLFCLAIFVTLAAECLVIAWSAMSHRPRLLRGLVGWAAIALLISARAYIPALVFTMTAVLAWGLASAICRWQSVAVGDAKASNALWQFQLGDVLLLILVVATIAALLRQFPNIRWPAAVALLPLLGLPLAPILVFAHYTVAGRSRVRMVVATVVAVVASAAFLAWSDVVQQLQLSSLIRLQTNLIGNRRLEMTLSILLIACLAACIAIVVGLAIKLWNRPPEMWKRITYSLALALTASLGVLVSIRYIDELLLRRTTDIGVELLWVGAHAVPLMCLALLVAAQAWLMNVNWRQASRSLRLARGLAIVAATIVAVPATWLYRQMVRPLPFPPPPAAAANHYERIIEICKELAAQRGSIQSPGISVTPLVEEAERLLQEPNFVPTEFLEYEARGVYPLRVTGGELYTLSRCLNDAAERTAKWPDFDRAADHCLAAIRFSEMFQRGGTAGNSVALLPRRAIDLLAEHRGQVSVAKAREVMRAIEQALETRDDLDTLLSRDRICWERRMGWVGRLKYRLAETLGEDQLVFSPANDYLAGSASLRGLQTLFAIRLFQEENRRLPRELSELVPEYLLTIPVDPFSQQTLIYRPAFDDFELYSVGRDRTDNGGRFDINGDYGPAGLDLDLSGRKVR